MKIVLFLLIVITYSTFAQWSSDPSVNTPVCVAAENQKDVALVMNNEGNIFVSWTDSRNSVKSDIYIQSLNPNGEVRWTTNGIPVKIDTLTSGVTRIVDDGAGGVIIIWHEAFPFNSRIVAQRVDANGNLMWNPGGLVLSQATYPITISEATPVTDGSGGIYAVWVTNSGGVENDIYCQRVGSNGQFTWGAPVPVCNLPGSQSVISVDSDKQGGVIISWSDFRSGNMDIYAQRLDPLGNYLWALNGKVVCNEPSNQGQSKISVDEQGNSYITWEDRRNNALNPDIYAQKLDSNGNDVWIANGVPVGTNYLQTKPVIVPDNLGGAIVAWTDQRNVGGEDIYAQRINSTGNAQWTSNGIPISNRSAALEGNIKIVSDNSGGAILCWQVFLGAYDLVAQRVDANGTVQWAQDGIYVCNASGNQSLHQIVLDEDDNLVVGWQDSRNGSDLDVYIQRVNNDGTLGNPTNLEETTFSLNDFNLFQNYPNPFNPSTKISWQSPVSSWQTLKVYDLLGREVATLVDEFQEAGRHSVEFDAARLPSGIYFYRLQADGLIQTRKMVVLK